MYVTRLTPQIMNWFTSEIFRTFVTRLYKICSMFAMTFNKRFAVLVVFYRYHGSSSFNLRIPSIASYCVLIYLYYFMGMISSFKALFQKYWARRTRNRRVVVSLVRMLSVALSILGVA
jgi:hypothetical protein